MAATSSSPLAAVLLLVVSAVVVPAAGGGGKQYRGGARMVIIRRQGTGTRSGGSATGARASSNEWRYGRGRLLEDEVAPELGGGLLGAGEGGSIGYGALEKGRPGCQSSSQCAAKGGGSYTRGCTYQNHCPH